MKIIKLSQNLQLVKTITNLTDRETHRAIRDALVNEQLAIQQYENICDGTKNKHIKEVLQDIANEEKVHVGELLKLLSEFDNVESESIEEGEKEVQHLRQ